MSGKQAKPRGGRSARVAERRDNRRIHRWQAGVTLGLCAAVIAILLVCGWAVSGDQRQWSGWLGNTSPEETGSTPDRMTDSSPDRMTDSSPDRMTGRLAYRQQQPAELGVYSVFRYDDITETLMRVDFKLVGQTSGGDESSFEQFMQANADSFRKQVCRTVREARLSELSDSELLARKIAMQINRVHEETFLHSVQLKDLEIFEEIKGYSPTPWEAVAAE